jgi:hypothetical protein
VVGVRADADLRRHVGPAFRLGMSARWSCSDLAVHVGGENRDFGSNVLWRHREGGGAIGGPDDDAYLQATLVSGSLREIVSGRSREYGPGSCSVGRCCGSLYGESGNE